MASVLKEAYFHDEAAAFTALEAIMWPNGKPEHCPHCGVADKCRRLAVQTSKPSKRNPEGKLVHGLWKCYACRGQFTVRKGTVFEESRLELHLWFQVAFLMCSSKKGVSPLMTESRKTKAKRTTKDDFESVAKRLGADEDKARFEAKLRTIAKAKPTTAKSKR